MIAKELIAILQDMDENALVLMPGDGEWSTVDVVSCNTFDPATNKLGLPEITDELISKGFTEEEDVLPTKAVVLWF